MLNTIVAERFSTVPKINKKAPQKFCSPGPSARDFSITDIDLRFRGILVTQVAHVVPYPVTIVSENEDRLPGSNHTTGGRSARSLASLDSGPP